MTSNQILSSVCQTDHCQTHLTYYNIAFFSNNLFSTKFQKVFLITLFLYTLTVQHVAAEQSAVQASKFFTSDSFKSFYSTRTASSHSRLIPESSLNLKNNPNIIQTTNGKVLGKRLKAYIKPTQSNDYSLNPKLSRIEEYDVDTFLGIPFAKAPVGNLRFQKPMPLDSSAWNGYVFNATSLADACVQLNDTFFGEFRGSTMWNANTALSEDCLTANIWVPRRLKKPNKLLPVMVWIYGGAFYSGSIAIDIYDALIFAARGDVVIVSINYRVASLGFFFLDRKDTPGNVALLDQILALEWIKKNIRSFGGDPDSITLFGESAGAASIAFLILSPNTPKNLFHRAILQSGAATSPWSISKHEVAIYRSLHIAENVGCIKPTVNLFKTELDKEGRSIEVRDLRRYKNYDYRNDPDLVKCLQNKDALELLKNEPNNTSVIEFPFVPIVDGDILPEEPSILLKKRNFKPIPVLLGSVTNEAFYFLVYHLSEYLKINETNHITHGVLEKIIRENINEDDLILDAIVQKYTNWKNTEDVEKNQEIIDNFFGDIKFTCSMNELSKSFSDMDSTVFHYVFSHRSSISPWPKWMGVLHGDEINFIFGEPLNAAFNYRPAEVRLSERMIAFWVNFASNGDPLKVSNEDLPQLKYPIREDKWLPFTKQENAYKILNLNINESVQLGTPRADYCAFWNDYIPRFREKIKQRKLCNSAIKNFNLTLILLLSTLIVLTFNYHGSKF